MAERLSRKLIAEQAIIHEAPALRAPTSVDRSFELPIGLLAGSAFAYVAFIAIMAVGFGNPHLIVPMGIILVFFGMAFAVPAMWMRMKPEHPQRLTPWSRFRRQGIMTAFGPSTANAATIQVLILPVLILLWGLAVVAIAAVVR